MLLKTGKNTEAEKHIKHTVRVKGKKYNNIIVKIRTFNWIGAVMGKRDTTDKSKEAHMHIYRPRVMFDYVKRLGSSMYL